MLTHCNAIICVLTVSQIKWCSLYRARLIRDCLSAILRFLRVRLDFVHQLHIACIGLLLFRHRLVRRVGKRLLLLIFRLERRCRISFFAFVEGTAHLQRVVKIFGLSRSSIKLRVLRHDTWLSFIVLR